MGIINATPDSFSDGGRYETVSSAIDQALKMVEQGAEIIDVGGESTRPGAEPVSMDAELDRVLPVIEGIRKKWDGAISIDTSKAVVAHEAIQAGATIVNDVTGLTDPDMVLACRDGEVGIVSMHMQGNPQTMQVAPSYGEVVEDIKAFFSAQYEMLTVAGIPSDRICFDPGIGFGKTLEHNLSILDNLPTLVVHGRPLLIGVSRKSFLGKLLGDGDTMEAREAATIALTAEARKHGACLHRVHQVKENYEAVRMAEAILAAK